METIIIALVFLWLGFVGAISFMESWLKFRVKELTLPIGLKVGQKVFGALNKVEIFISLVLICIALLYLPTISTATYILLAVAMSFVLIQTFLLLPMLDKRVDILLKGEKPKKSMLHMYYVTSEMAKVACLIIVGIKLI